VLDSVHSDESESKAQEQQPVEEKDIEQVARHVDQFNAEPVLQQQAFLWPSSNRGGRVSDGRVYAPNRIRTEEEQMFYTESHRIGPNSIGGAP
jgi:hypothetical protein